MAEAVWQMGKSPQVVVDSTREFLRHFLLTTVLLVVAPVFFLTPSVNFGHDQKIKIEGGCMSDAFVILTANSNGW